MKKILFLGLELHGVKFFTDPLIVNEMVASYLVNSDRDASDILKKARTPGLRDALARAVHLFNVFETTRKQLLKQDKGSNTLPIFMAPEFYFRRENDPYSKNDFYSLLDYLKVKSKKYPHWLFIPGSVWWGDKTIVDEKEALVVHNSVPVLNDGELVHTYLKQLASGFDKLLGAGEGQYWDGDSMGNLVNNPNLPDEYKEKMLSNILSEYNKVRVQLRKDKLDSNLFTFDGLKFGIEVCLDHSGGFLKTELKNKRNVDVHLVTACGTRRMADHVMAKNNGCFLRVDSYLGPFSEACFVSGQGDSNQTKITASGAVTGFDDVIAKQLAIQAPKLPETVRIFETVVL